MAGSLIAKVISARIPAPLYEKTSPIVKAINGPSWGQLVAWACELEMGDVLAHIERASVVDVRAPRGHNRVGAGGHLISARLTAPEMAAVERTMNHARDHLGIDTTSTKLVIAALTVASRQVEPPGGLGRTEVDS